MGWESSTDTLGEINLKFPTKEIKQSEDDEFSEWDEENDSNEDKSKYWFNCMYI